MLLLLMACAPRLVSPEKTACEDSENVWFHGEAPGELEAQGFELGERPPDFCQQDQNDQTVSLHQFYGAPVVLDVSTGWCGPCGDLAGEIGLTERDYEDFGLVYLSVLPQDWHAGPATAVFADEWEKSKMVREDVVDHDGNHDPRYDGLPLDDVAPVIADADLWSLGVTESVFPKLLLLDEALVVVAVLHPTDSGIREGLDEFFGLDAD